MRILTVGDFDPAGVHIRHRRWLNRIGFDYRVAVRNVYRDEGHEADWVLERGTDGLREFAESADVIQFLPGIGQPWSFAGTDPRFHDADAVPFGDVDWADTPLMRAKRVAVIHGSVNMRANVKGYAAHYRGRGMSLLATTLDYVEGAGAKYLPALVDLPSAQTAKLREIGDPLRVVATPTDPSVSQTDDFVSTADRLGIKVRVVSGKPHRVALDAKRKAHIGFDHMRGAFSVNSLENSAVGLANIVGMSEYALRYMEKAEIQAPPWPRVTDMVDVSNILRDLARCPIETANLQQKCWAWFWKHWNPEVVAARLAEMYRAL